MEVRSLVTGFDLTKGKVYGVRREYDTVYELMCDTGVYCRSKEYFEIVGNEDVEVPKTWSMLDHLDKNFGDKPYTVAMYNTVSGELRQRVRMNCWLTKNVGGKENFIEINFGTDNELTVYERELEPVFIKDNVSIMKYGEFLIICTVTPKDFLNLNMQGCICP